MAMPELEVAQAFDEALRAAADGDEKRRWELVTRLHLHGGAHALRLASRWSTADASPRRSSGSADGVSSGGSPCCADGVLSRGLPCCADGVSSRRELVADVLGQLGGGPGRSAVDGEFRDDALALLLAMAESEQHPAVLESIAVGFGHIGDERCLEPLIRWHTHPDADVRYGVVFGLLGRPEPAALDALITLSADREAPVRDWATFGLARRTEADFPRLRAALAARLDDEDPDARAEAIHGLAVRGDERAIEPLLLALRSPDIGEHAIIPEGLPALALATLDPRLYEPLLADRATWPDDHVPETLRAALNRYANRAPPP